VSKKKRGLLLVLFRKAAAQQLGEGRRGRTSEKVIPGGGESSIPRKEGGFTC